jgi:hypothetical protein
MFQHFFECKPQIFLEDPVTWMDSYHNVQTHLNNTDQYRPDVQPHWALSDIRVSQSYRK